MSDFTLVLPPSGSGGGDRERRYQDYEWMEALADFLKAVRDEETAELRWSS